MIEKDSVGGGSDTGPLDQPVSRGYLDATTFPGEDRQTLRVPFMLFPVVTHSNQHSVVPGATSTELDMEKN